jgi:hypothetical protein
MEQIEDEYVKKSTLKQEIRNQRARAARSHQQERSNGSGKVRDFVVSKYQLLFEP